MSKILNKLTKGGQKEEQDKEQTFSIQPHPAVRPLFFIPNKLEPIKEN